MKNTVKFSVMFLVFLLISCGSKDQEIEKLKGETIEIHDEVMPKMDVIMELKASLKAGRDSVTTQEDEKIQELIISLEEADKAMMNWMRNYDPKMENMSESEKIEYLNDQKASISDVSEQMKKSIAAAKDYLNQ